MGDCLCTSKRLMDKELHHFLFLKQPYEEVGFSKLRIIIYSVHISMRRPVSVDAPSKAWVCGRSVDGIVGSNNAGGHGCLYLLSTVRLSLVLRSPTGCGVSVLSNPQH